MGVNYGVKVRKILEAEGIKKSLAGYSQLSRAIELLLKDEISVYSRDRMTQIYNKINQEMNVSVVSIERNMRYAIQKSSKHTYFTIIEFLLYVYFIIKSEERSLKQQQIESLILETGVPRYNIAYQYILDTVEIMYTKGVQKHILTKSVLPEVANKYNLNVKQLQMSMSRLLKLNSVKDAYKVNLSEYLHDILYQYAELRSYTNGRVEDTDKN